MKGILFKPEMSLAIREGRKTVTRRVLKIQPVGNDVEIVRDVVRGTLKYAWGFRAGPSFGALESGGVTSNAAVTLCDSRNLPYRPGETVYVKEGYVLELPPNLRYDAEGLPPSQWPAYLQTQTTVHYMGDHEGWKWRSPLHLPEWAARTFLVIEDVRVERLQDIDEEDAMREGLLTHPESYELAYLRSGGKDSLRLKDFAALWDSINTGPGARWQDNPWIARIQFRLREEA